MAVVKVQNTGVQGGLASTQTLAYSSNVVAGNLLTCQVIHYRDSGHKNYSVTDSQGNAWTLDAEANDSPTHPDYASTWRTIAGSSAANTITITNLDGTAYTSLGIAEFSGVNTVADVTSGLQGWWKLDDGSGSSAVDSSGNGNTGTLVNTPPWATQAKIGPAALFFNKSSDQYVNLGNPSALQITGNITISAWVKTASSPSSGAGFQIVAKDSDTAGRSYTLDINDNSGADNARFYVNGGTGSAVVIAPTTIVVNTWYHIVGTYDTAGIVTIFINSAQDNQTISTPNPITNSTGDALIGRRRYSGFEEPMDGTIDDVRIYNRVLSGAEIIKLYQRGIDLIGATNNTATGANASAGSIVSDVNGSLYVGGMSHDDGNSSGTSGSGFSDIYINQATSNQPIYSEYQIQSTAGSLAIVWVNNSTDYVAAGAAYRPAAGGGGGVIKTIDGLAFASVKTINGVAIASVKTYDGVAAQ